MKEQQKIRKLAMTAMLSAVSAVLMFFSFNVPLMPTFIKMDLSELPALIASFSMGPLSGVMVCLVKNLINVFFSTTGGVGELSNFVLGASFVWVAGMLYRWKKNRTGALVGSVIGAAVMAGISMFSNYYVMYPFYSTFMPIEQIIAMYQAINPNVDGLWQCLLVFNLPYTFIKGILVAAITFLVYKHISPLIKGVNRQG